MRRFNLLLVDDEADIRKVLQGLLKGETVAPDVPDLKYEIKTASQGQEAVDLVKQFLETDFRIHVAFIDMHMPPGWSGVETINRIHQIDDRIEFVLVTSSSEKVLAESLKNVARSDRGLYLRKPFYKLEIRQFARNLSEKYRLERVKEEFIAHVSHELSTPLSSILGFSELLQSSSELGPSDLESAMVCHSNALFLKDMVEDLIDVARMQRPVDMLRYTTTSANKIFQKVKEITRQLQVENSNIKCEFQELPEDVRIRCDVTLVKRAIMNLITNAYRYTQSGKISIKLRKIKASLNIAVQDTGIRMPRNKQDQILKFSTIQFGRQRSWSRAWTLYCESSCEQHKGTIILQSESVGSTFEMSLPILVEK